MEILCGYNRNNFAYNNKIFPGKFSVFFLSSCNKIVANEENSTSSANFVIIIFFSKLLFSVIFMHEFLIFIDLDFDCNVSKKATIPQNHTKTPSITICRFCSCHTDSLFCTFFHSSVLPITILQITCNRLEIQ